TPGCRAPPSGEARDTASESGTGEEEADSSVAVNPRRRPRTQSLGKNGVRNRFRRNKQETAQSGPGRKRFLTPFFRRSESRLAWRAGFPAGRLGVMPDVPRLLAAMDQGAPHAAGQLLPLVYDELRRLAAQKLAQEKPGQTLEATALVHEAYLRLVDADAA